MGGNTENRSNGKGHGDSSTLVISDNGGRTPRAVLREAVMTKATLATIGSVNVRTLSLFVAQSGLVLICLVVRQMGCTLWSDHQWGRIWGAAYPSITTAKPRPPEGDNGGDSICKTSLK